MNVDISLISVAVADIQNQICLISYFDFKYLAFINIEINYKVSFLKSVPDLAKSETLS